MEINFGKNEIGKRIAEYRRERKLTQEELANRIGISAQALSQYERGMRYPDIEILKSLCTVLGVSSDYLIGLKETKINEIDDVEIEKEIWWNLRNSLSALSIVFGSDYVPSWNNNKHVELISNLRLRLSRDGILMPIVRLSDWIQLKPREFIILAYDNVPPVAPRSSRPRALRTVLPERRRLDLHLRYQGRQGRGVEIHRRARDLLAARKRRGREEFGHPSCVHHPLAALRRRTAGSGDPPEHHPALDRHRTYRRYHRGP